MTLAVDVYQLKLANFVFKFLFKSWKFSYEANCKYFSIIVLSWIRPKETYVIFRASVPIT